MRGSMPGGVIAASRLAAPPVSARVGAPDAQVDHPHVAPEHAGAQAVPSALAQASLAAKRLA